MTNVLVFAIGWVLFVLGQAQNSLKSSSNSLSGWAGWKKWLSGQAVNLLIRAFFSVVFYSVIVQKVTSALLATGFKFSGTATAAIGGFAANALLYQIIGLLPILRVEVAELAPAPKVEVVPPTGPAGTH